MSDTPKTESCCGSKPKRTFYQTQFRNDEGYWLFQCRKCKSGVRVENQYRGTAKSELEATLEWNCLVTQRPGSAIEEMERRVGVGSKSTNEKS